MLAVGVSAVPVTVITEAILHVMFCVNGATVDDGIARFCVTAKVCVDVQPDTGLVPVTVQVP